MILQLAQDATSNGDDTMLMWGFILMGVAVFLLFVELFIPSGGLIGLVAGVAAILSLVAFFRYDTIWGMVFLSIDVILGPIAIGFGFKWWINSPLSRGIILSATVDEKNEHGDESPEDSYESRRMARQQELRGLIGATGTSETALRPVGTVIIEGERLEALADTGAIDAGMPIVVCDVYDNQVKVRPAQ